MARLAPIEGAGRLTTSKAFRCYSIPSHPIPSHPIPSPHVAAAGGARTLFIDARRLGLATKPAAAKKEINWSLFQPSSTFLLNFSLPNLSIIIVSPQQAEIHDSTLRTAHRTAAKNNTERTRTKRYGTWNELSLAPFWSLPSLLAPYLRLQVFAVPFRPVRAHHHHRRRRRRPPATSIVFLRHQQPSGLLFPAPCSVHQTITTPGPTIQYSLPRRSLLCFLLPSSFIVLFSQSWLVPLSGHSPLQLIEGRKTLGLIISACLHRRRPPPPHCSAAHDLLILAIVGIAGVSGT